jgi:hypothetical protein
MGKKSATVKSASLLQRALSPDQEWEKDELFEVLYWARQVMGLVLGLVWGVLQLSGSTALLLYGAAYVACNHLYSVKFLGVDEDDFGRWEMLKQGAMPSFGMFMITWIAVYSIPY